MLAEHVRILGVRFADITEDGKSAVIEFDLTDGGTAGVMLSLDELEYRASAIDDGGQQSLLETVSALIRRAARID